LVYAAKVRIRYIKLISACVVHQQSLVNNIADKPLWIKGLND